MNSLLSTCPKLLELDQEKVQGVSFFPVFEYELVWQVGSNLHQPWCMYSLLERLLTNEDETPS